jgi:hypothetical protein
MEPEDVRVKDARAWLRKAELGRQCAVLDATLRTVVDQAVPLTEFAWRYRYPGESDEPEREEARQALAAARDVYDAILTRVPPEAQQ